MTTTGLLTPAEFDAALADASTGGRLGMSTLFGAYHPRLIRYLRAIEPRHADDIASDTWLSVATGIADFSGDQAAFVSSVFTIARSRLADRRRTASKRRIGPVADIAARRRPAGSDAVVDHLDAQHAIDLIARVLTSEEAEFVLLRVLGGLSIREVAEVTGHDDGWVRVTTSRALQRLRDRFDRFGG